MLDDISFPIVLNVLNGVNKNRQQAKLVPLEFVFYQRYRVNLNFWAKIAPKALYYEPLFYEFFLKSLHFTRPFWQNKSKMFIL